MAPATIGFTELLKKRNRAKLSYVYSIFSTGMPNLVLPKFAIGQFRSTEKGVGEEKGW